jgi:ABC-type multidrug transport system fused ATPase/permease subunit
MASSERIFNLIDDKPVIVDPPEPRTIPEFKGEIVFDNVSFAYKEPEYVLKELSFTVQPGEKIAVVGATGAGKTSLVSLLFRFYDFQTGDIRIDGISVKDMSADYLRSHLGLVLQDVFIFSGDYSDNIHLNEKSMSKERIEWAAEQVGIASFIRRQPDGFATEVMERGATISTGQKQLLSFARALAHDPKILILDEATSSVDNETEAMIQKAIEKLMQGRTSIIIAHRLSTIEKADRILVMHKGRLRETGTHKELLAQKGIYHTLYQTQFTFARQEASRARVKT